MLRQQGPWPALGDLRDSTVVAHPSARRAFPPTNVPWLDTWLGTTTELWDRQAGALAERFRVLRYDHRGHGGSPAPDGPYSIDDIGGDLLALLDRLAIARASICGVSLGGMVGMWLAARAPERVDRLVLCCTSARISPPIVCLRTIWNSFVASWKRRVSGLAAPQTMIGAWRNCAARTSHSSWAWVAGTTAARRGSDTLCCMDERWTQNDPQHVARVQGVWNALEAGDFATALDSNTDDVIFENGPGAGPWRQTDGKPRSSTCR